MNARGAGRGRVKPRDLLGSRALTGAVVLREWARLGPCVDPIWPIIDGPDVSIPPKIARIGLGLAQRWVFRVPINREGPKVT